MIQKLELTLSMTNKSVSFDFGCMKYVYVYMCVCAHVHICMSNHIYIDLIHGDIRGGKFVVIYIKKSFIIS